MNVPRLPIPSNNQHPTFATRPDFPHLLPDLGQGACHMHPSGVIYYRVYTRLWPCVNWSSQDISRHGYIVLRIRHHASLQQKCIAQSPSHFAL